jgi:hypothetical protein
MAKRRCGDDLIRGEQPAGQIIVTSRSSSEDHWQQQVFDPTRVPAGVELSDDPILTFGRRHTRCPRNAAKDKLSSRSERR